MILPKINYPLFKMTIPSTGQQIDVRQMLAKEEKILLMAKTGESNDEDVLNAIKQSVNNCIVTPGIDVDNIALFDLEYLFIRLRAISVSNVLDVAYADMDEVAEFEKERVNNPNLQAPPPHTFQIDLNKVDVKWPESRSLEIPVGENIRIKMRYPSAALYSNKEFQNMQPRDAMEYLIKVCIEEVRQGGAHFKIAEQDPKEVIDYLNELPVDVYNKLRDFMSNLPTIYHELTYTNKFGTERKIVLNNLSSFFPF